MPPEGGAVDPKQDDTTVRPKHIVPSEIAWPRVTSMYDSEDDMPISPHKET